MKNISDFYKEKGTDYFSLIRTDISFLLPDNANNILDIGCGQGSTLLWLKNIFNCRLTCGVELTKNASAIARLRADYIVQGNIETIELPFKKNSFDLILCLDIFEHLIDPWNLVKRIAFVLKPGGCLIASIPNIKHHSVLLPLLLEGQWNYTYNGILDKTHLRFFTRKTAISLLNSNGLYVEKIYSSGREKKSKSRIANLISLGLFKVIFETEYLMRAKKLE
jgi:SAM-dependent methyltransferase